jgi:hypothetical protein
MLARLPADIKASRFAVSITRLTILKSLCQDTEAAHQFVTYLAQKTLEQVEHGRGRSSHPNTAEQRHHRQLMTEALAEMQAWVRESTDRRHEHLAELRWQMVEQQNEYENISWGAVRLVKDCDLLLFEDALTCLLQSPEEAGHWAYETAKTYTEQYDPRYGTGLIPKSVPLVQDIVGFWVGYFQVNPAALAAPPAKTRRSSRSSASDKPTGRGGKAKATRPTITPRQGQFLAFIHLYRKLHRQAPAELDMVRFFQVTPPSVHTMVVKLVELGLITRQPGVARSIRLTLAEKEIPALVDVPGPSW